MIVIFASDRPPVRAQVFYASTRDKIRRIAARITGLPFWAISIDFSSLAGGRLLFGAEADSHRAGSRERANFVMNVGMDQGGRRLDGHEVIIE